MKKRIAILFLAALLAVTSSTTALAAPAPLFTDLSEDHWSYQYVSDLVSQGVVNGYPDHTFKPQNTVTWGEAFKLILLAVGVEDPEPAGPGEHWALRYVQPALDNRLVYDFNPSQLDSVPTRLSVARMTARALDLTDIAGPSPYTDCEDGYVVELYEKGVMDGFLSEDGVRTFQPDKPISREEMSAIIWRVRNANPTAGMIRYNNYYIDRLEDVPASPFTAQQFTRNEAGRLSYSGGYFTHGIDVSGHKQAIDWEAVAGDGIDFAIIRAGNRFYGKDGSGAVAEDSWFERNMEGAIAAGLPVGAYFFSNAITVEEAIEEADLILSKLEPYREHVTYPVVCDWEFLGGKNSRAYGVDARIITQCIDAFCRRIEEAGYIPMLYFNEYCGNVKMDLSKLTQYHFWYAEYASAPSCMYNFQFWQYSSTGKVAGISSNVDMDLCFIPFGDDVPDPPGPEPTEPAETEPVETGPVETQPLETQPLETQPAETAPAETGPVEPQP